MNEQRFFKFVKWYFNFTSEKFYGRPSNATMFYISKKERLVAIFMAYLLFFVSWSILFLKINGIFFIFLADIIVFITLLCLTRFSISYYILLFYKIHKKNRSINDRAIVEECIFYNFSKQIRNAILKYYKIADVRGNIFYLKYFLTVKNGNRNIKKYITLKITSNKIYLNNDKISTVRLNDICDFEELIKVKKML